MGYLRTVFSLEYVDYSLVIKVLHLFLNESFGFYLLSLQEMQESYGVRV